jgi:predicted DNA-binding protein with PD1-like motif
MEQHRLSGVGERRFLLVFADGEEVVRGLAGFAREQRVAAAEFTGIGSLAEAELEGRGRLSADEEPLDVRPLDGTVLLTDDEPRVRVDVVDSPPGGQRRSGRLTSGRVRDVLKLVLTEVAVAEVAPGQGERPA